MNNIENLLKKIEDGVANWYDYSNFLKLNQRDIDSFLDLAFELKIKNFGDIIKIYIPNRRFPAISITGDKCALNCDHCNKKYLRGMKGILNNHDLERFLFKHFEKGGVGVLLSGGCDLDGAVPIYNFLDSIKKVKNQTNLIINVHTGLLNEKTAKKLADSGVDIISFDINMDEDVINQIYHLDKSTNDYKSSIEYLKENHLSIVPHICIGLYYGKLHKELEAIKFIKESGINPQLVVLIALIPPKYSKESFSEPNPIDIAKIISIVRFVFPYTEISLGCMRPRGKRKFKIEKYAIRAGITRIEIPSIKTLKWLKEFRPNVFFKFFSACCAIPKKFENLAKSKVFDLKKYGIFVSDYE